jgi:hypothetical protein
MVIRCCREINPLFRLLRRVSLNLLNLQAFFQQNHGRSSPVLRNPLFLPLLPADSVRLPFAKPCASASRLALLTLAEDDKR